MSGLYYHDAGRGEYHRITHADRPRSWQVELRLDPASGQPRTWTGFLPTLRAARAVLRDLAPDAVLLPGLPAWMR